MPLTPEQQVEWHRLEAADRGLTVDGAAPPLDRVGDGGLTPGLSAAAARAWEEAELDDHAPGWRATTNEPAFVQWALAGDEEVRRMFFSDQSADVLHLITMYRGRQ